MFKLNIVNGFKNIAYNLRECNTGADFFKHEEMVRKLLSGSRLQKKVSYTDIDKNILQHSESDLNINTSHMRDGIGLN